MGAINGGKGWKSVEFSNHQIDLNGDTAVAMGSYDFTCATTGDVVTVEYTFGYKRCTDGKPRIFLHHSSVPYSGGGAETRSAWLKQAKEQKSQDPKIKKQKEALKAAYDIGALTPEMFERAKT